MPEKHALIIGINKYLYRGEDEQLGGCVNDAKLMGSVLVNKFNFDPANIVTLCDEEATLDAITAQMDRLVALVQKDDILVFHFSGHGSQCKIRTEYTDEGSGKDNYIIPSDDSEPTEEGPVIWRDVRDHQFNDWLQRIAEKTRYTTLIFDCCHSGTMTRGIAGSAKARGLPPDDRPARSGARSSQAASRGAAAADPAAGTGTGAWLNLSDNYVVISGCRDSQTSAEDYFLVDDEYVKHGMLSYNLTGALMRAKSGTSYRDVFERVVAGVVAQNPGQNPQIEGSLDRELFGVKDMEPMCFAPVSGVDGDTVTLEGGAAQGIRSGSRWAIYPPGTRQQHSATSLGEMEIRQVGALSSSGVMIENGGQVVPGAWCVEVESVTAPDTLRVALPAVGSDSLAAIEPGIRGSALLELAGSPEAAHIHGTIVDSERSLPAGLSVQQQQSITGPTWAFFENNGALCMPLHPIDEPGVAATLVANIEKIARYRNVLRLDNPQSTLDVEFNLYRQGPDGEVTLAGGGNSEFSDGEPLVLELISHEKERAVFFSILWISASREISHCYPPRRVSEELSPGKTVRIGYGQNKLRVRWDDNYFDDIVSECCKLMLSTRESDFSWLEQEGVRSAGGSTSGIPAFDAAFRGSEHTAADQNQRSAIEQPAHDEWGAVNRCFLITNTAV